MKSKLEAAIAFRIKALGLPKPEREFRFDPKRKWRFDFAWPDVWIALECEGGVWSGGRHVRGAGFEKDVEKYNAAGMASWTILRVTTGMVRNGQATKLLDWVKYRIQITATPF